MDEDLALNRLVKSALEAKGPFAWRQPETASQGWPVRRKRLSWATAALLAASVAMVASFHLPGRAHSSSVEDALRLLTEAENVTLQAGESQTATSLLLAWQEAQSFDCFVGGRAKVE